MAKIRIYLTKGCPFCTEALHILKTLPDASQHELEVIDVTVNRPLRQEISKSVGNWPTVPMIFVNEHFIGGCTDLIQALDSGKFAQILKTTS